MYLEYLGLECHPFEDRAGTQFFLATPDREESLAAMQYAASPGGPGTALLLGGSGLGKTMLVRALLHRFGRADQAVVLTWPHGSEMRLIRETGKGFGVTLPTSYSDAHGLARLRKHLTKSGKSGRRSILIVDQADHLSPSGLAQLVTLADMHHRQDRLLSIILAARPRFEAMIQTDEHERLQQLFFERRVLRPLSAQETGDYIHHRLQMAGAAESNIFDADAISLIHGATRGIPRLINKHCNAALVAAFGARSKTIDSELAQEVIDSRASETVVPAAISSATVRDATDVQVLKHASIRGAGVELPASDPAKEEDPQTRMTASAPAQARHASQPARRESARQSTVRQAPRGQVDDETLMRGEDLLARLERAMARAERFAATSEGMLMQSTAVEKHLASLSKESEQRFAQFERTLDRLSDTLAEADTRAQRIVSQSQDGVCRLEEKLDAVADQVRSADDAAARMGGVCEQADASESKLRTLADELADKTDAVQERLAAIMSAVSANDDAEATLNRLLAEREEHQGQVQRDIEKLAQAHDGVAKLADDTETRMRGHGQEVVAELKRKFVRATHEALEDYRKTLEVRFERRERDHQESVEQLEQRLGTLTEKSAAELTERTSAIEKLMDGFRAQFSRMSTECAEKQRELADVLTRGTSAIQRTVDDGAQRIAEQQHNAHAAVASAEAKLQSVTERIENLSNAVQSEFTRAESLATMVTDTAERIGTSTIIVNELNNRADGAASTTRENLAKADKLLAQVRAATGEMQTAHRSVSASLVDVGAMCERAATARTQLKEYAEVADRIDELVTASQSAQQSTRASIEASQEAQDALNVVTRSADDRLAKLDSHVAAAKRLLHDLSNANVEGHKSAERFARQLTESQEAHESLKRLAEEVESLAGRAESIAGSVATEREQANTVLTGLQSVRTDAQKIAERLTVNTHNAAELNQQLASTGAQMQSVLQVAEASVRALETAKGQRQDIEDALKVASGSLDELTTRIAEAESRLADGETGARDIVQTFQQTAQTATQHMRNLQEAIDAAGVREESIRQAQAAAEELAKSIASIGTTTESAKEIEAAVRQAAGEADNARSRLESAASDAHTRSNSLRELNLESGALHQRHQALIHTSVRVVEELEAKSTSAQVNTDTAERLLTEFQGQAAKLQSELQALHDQITRLEKFIAESTAQPEALIAKAQAQASQLERVCAAVRKVFGGLSKLTLDADKKSVQLRSSSENAAAKIEALQYRACDAGDTLREWVEEAARAQARLQRLLERTPTIAQTHPAKDVASVADPSDGLKRAPRAGSTQQGGESTRSESTQALTPVALERTAVIQAGQFPASRADQVAALIQEAKQVGLAESDRLTTEAGAIQTDSRRQA